jgi:hypothetical protein
MKHKLLNYFCLLFLLAFVTGCEEDNKDELNNYKGILLEHSLDFLDELDDEDED